MVQSFRSFLADFSANMMQNTEYSTDFRGKMLVVGEGKHIEGKAGST